MFALGETFDSASEDDWRGLVEKGLKGRSFETLQTVAEDGFVYGPIETRRTDATPLARGTTAPWTILQPVDDVDPQRGNKQALEDLEGGATGLAIAFAGASAARGFGLPCEASTLGTALARVETDIIALRIEPHPGAVTIADWLAEHLGERTGDAPPVDLSHDPIGCGAGAGSFGFNAAQASEAIAEDLRALANHRFAATLVEADGRIYHDAGATDGQEIGAVLATALAYLRAFKAAGIAPQEAAQKIGLSLAVDQRQFLSMAKLRAMRLTFARLLEACGIDAPHPPRIHAETAFRMMAARDPHSNLLRATIAGFAAGVGGADSLTVLPHTAPLGLADGAARRLARNIQILLQEETGLDRPIDPACGSGAFEALTDDLAKAGWEAFTAIEAEGGIVRSLGDGRLQARIAEQAKSRQSMIEGGEIPIIGVSRYPLGEERTHRLLAERPVPVEAPRGDFPALTAIRSSATLETRA